VIFRRELVDGTSALLGIAVVEVDTPGTGAPSRR
jgi:hypothetical protein